MPIIIIGFLQPAHPTTFCRLIILVYLRGINNIIFAEKGGQGLVGLRPMFIGFYNLPTLPAIRLIILVYARVINLINL